MTREAGGPRDGPSTASRQLHRPALLAHPDFRRYWSAQTISYLGDQVTIVALPLIAVLTLHASALQVGVLSAAGSLPNLLFALHSGSLADRGARRRRLMIVADLVRAVLLASVPVAYAFGALTLGQLYVVAFGTGTLAVLFAVAAAGLFAAVVPREDYVQANSLSRGSYSFSWTAGPGVAGVLIQLVSAPVVIVLDAVSFLGSGFLLGRIGVVEQPGEDADRGHIRDGLRWVLRTPAVLVKLAADAILNFFYSIYFALLFLFAARQLHLSAGLIGLVLAGGAVGALLGSAAAGSVTRRRGLGTTFFLGAFLYPGALLLVPVAHGPSWLAACLLIGAEFLSGFGLMLCDIAGSSIQQALTPDRLRSRVQGVYLLFNNGSRPLGALVGGACASLLGVRPTIALAAVGGVVCMAALWPSRLRRIDELPEQSGAS